MEPSHLFNLVEFDRDILRPSAAELSVRGRAAGFTNMVAAFFWLLFGLDAEYFPEAHAQSLFAQRFVQFAEDFEESYQQWGYLFDPEFRPLLTSARSFGMLVQRTEDLRVNGAAVAKAALRSALIAEAALRRSAQAQRFLSLLNFDTGPLEHIVATGQAVVGEGIIVQGDIAPGFLDVVSYMRALVDLSRALQREQVGGVAGLCDRRLRQLTRWRVNRHMAVDGLFKRVGLLVNERYLDGAYSAQQVSNDIDELLEDWGFSHLKEASAG